MALTFKKSTDAEHKEKLESELLYAGWKSGVVHAGSTAALEVKTAFVGTGSPIEITGKTRDGKKLGKIKSVVFGNSFTGALTVPDDVEEGDWASFEVSLPKCGLKGQADAVPVAPPIVVTNMKWSAKEARRGDIVTLSADVQGVRDGTNVAITVFEHDRDGVHDKIAELAAQTKDQKISFNWKYEYFEDTDEIPTDEELKRYGKSYNPPEYFFTLTIEGVEFGKKQESGLLEFKDWLELKLRDRDGAPIANERYVLSLPDGTTREGTLDGDGYVKLEQLPPGQCRISFPNVKGIDMVA